MREMKKPDILAFSAKTYQENGSGDDTLAADNEQDVLVSDFKAAVVMAALRGDALAHTVCQVSMKTSLITQTRRTTKRLRLLRTRRRGPKK